MTQTIKIPPSFLKHPVHFLSLGFGTGLSPMAPGTFGTAAAIPLFILFSYLPLQWYLFVTVVAVIFGIYCCGFTSKALGVHDHGGIVWDEVAGFLITMIAVPANLLNIAIGFALFRLFDIWKPWPINLLDAKVSGGFGIMIDDVLAGLYALGILQLAIYYNIL